MSGSHSSVCPPPPPPAPARRPACRYRDHWRKHGAAGPSTPPSSGIDDRLVLILLLKLESIVLTREIYTSDLSGTLPRVDLAGMYVARLFKVSLQWQSHVSVSLSRVGRPVGECTPSLPRLSWLLTTFVDLNYFERYPTCSALSHRLVPKNLCNP